MAGVSLALSPRNPAAHSSPAKHKMVARHWLRFSPAHPPVSPAPPRLAASRRSQLRGRRSPSWCAGADWRLERNGCYPKPVQ